MAKKAGCGGSFDGLCCRMVIETKRVFDGCKFVDDNTTLTLTTTEPVPQDAQFVAARAVGSEFVWTAANPDQSGCCRVTGDAITHFAVTYSYNGECFTVEACVRDRREVLLRLPVNALVPYDIELQTVMNATRGAVVGQNAVSVSGCLLQIIKVTAPVDILIPTYGYCKYPPCTGCPCSGLGDRVFPFFIDAGEN
jgi:hypothetical protein